MADAEGLSTLLEQAISLAGSLGALGTFGGLLYVSFRIARGIGRGEAKFVEIESNLGRYHEEATQRLDGIKQEISGARAETRENIKVLHERIDRYENQNATEHRELWRGLNGKKA